VRNDVKGDKRYLVIAENNAGKPGSVVQVQGR
jgi:hypothetical protein